MVQRWRVSSQLKERIQGPAFWRLVASLLPGYESRKEWLERFGVGLG